MKPVTGDGRTYKIYSASRTVTDGGLAVPAARRGGRLVFVSAPVAHIGVGALRRSLVEAGAHVLREHRARYAGEVDAKCTETRCGVSLCRLRRNPHLIGYPWPLAGGWRRG